MNKLMRYSLLILIFIFLVFGFFLVFITVTDYQPEERETLYLSDNHDYFLPDTNEYTALIWNIGYAGLGENMDFFYDGGVHVRDTYENTLGNLSKIKGFISGMDTVDFILLQEVDRGSKRSYFLDMKDTLTSVLSGYHSYFAPNYKVFHVPVPPTRPMGKVFSGLLSLSEPKPYGAFRYSFPGNYTWPKSLFMLDRCFLVSRYKLKNKKDLIIINTHNSAYDEDGELRREQMNFLKKFLKEEYANGNYLLVGGDWNQTPYNFQPDFENNVFDAENLQYIPDAFMPEGWTWHYRADIPTNRRVKTPYHYTSSPTTVIDFFLVSPNLKVSALETLDMNFKYSDHQPVFIKFKLED